MTEPANSLTVEATSVQKLADFTGTGWLKVIAPAKVNLYLAVGTKRPDGYHNVETIMHALNLHDVVYLRLEPTIDTQADAAQSIAGVAAAPPLSISLDMLAHSDIEVPDVPTEKNTAAKAVRTLARLLGRAERETLTIRIEKNVPAQAGLGGGSGDAAAALLGAAHLWGLDPADERIVQAAQETGSDVAFFLQGGCALYDGTGATFAHALAPAKTPVVLIQPAAGVPTGQAYAMFDDNPAFATEQRAAQARAAQAADQVELFNNLSPAAERILPELAEIKTWLAGQDGISGVLLTGSGSVTFGLCDSLARASSIVAEARKHGWWARATSLGSIRAAIALR